MPLRPQTLYPAHAQQHPAVAGGTVAILSADNPRFPAEAQGEEALKSELDRLGADYEITKGRYGAPERSFVVTNPDLPTVLDLGRRFGQESVAYSENGRHQLHYVNGTNAGMATAPSEGHTWSDAEPQDNYTAVPSPNGEPWGYFTWNVDFDSPLVPSSPTPMSQAQTTPMAKSEAPLVADVRRCLEALGELRARELAKAGTETLDMKKAELRPSLPGVSIQPGMHVKSTVFQALASAKRATPPPLPQQGAPAAAAKPPPLPGRSFTQPPPPAGASGRAQTLALKKGEPQQVAPHREPGVHEASGSPHSEPGMHERPVAKAENPERSVVNIETSPFKKPDWKPIGTQMKGEDAGSVHAMISGEVTKKGHSMAKGETSKVDPLDGDMSRGKHMCKMCKREMSPVMAAVRSKKGGVCMKCENGMAKGELHFESDGIKLSVKKSEADALTYDKNEPQHGKLDNSWKPTVKEPYKATGSGGSIEKTSIGTAANPGPASTTFPMKKGEPGQGEHGGSPKQPMSPAPAPAPGTTQGPKPRLIKSDGIFRKAEGMPMPAAPKPPQAPGAKPAMAGGMAKAEAPLAKTSVPGGKNVAQAHNEGKPVVATSTAHPIRGSTPTAAAHGVQPKPLAKAMPGSMAGDMAQAAHDASIAMPPAGKAQPKNPAEYDAAAFRPASPGAAGAPSGLELAGPQKHSAGFKPTVPPMPGKGGPGIAPPPLPTKASATKPGMTALSGGLPIAKMTNIRGAPLSKPKV